MLDSNTDAVKRYAPPQRSRVVNRRKPGVNHGDAGSSTMYNENANLRLIPLNGCSTSEVAQLLNERWAAAMQLYNDPSTELSVSGFRTETETEIENLSLSCIKLLEHVLLNCPASERPIMYSGAGGSSWGHVKLPHQMDFLAELRRAMQTQSNTPSNVGIGDHF